MKKIAITLASIFLATFAASADTLKTEMWEAEAKWRIDGVNYTATVEIDWPVSGPSQVVSTVKNILEKLVTIGGDGEEDSGILDEGWSKDKHSFKKSIANLGKKSKKEDVIWNLYASYTKTAEYDDVITYYVHESLAGECGGNGNPWANHTLVFSKNNGEAYPLDALISFGDDYTYVFHSGFNNDSLFVQYFQASEEENGVFSSECFIDWDALLEISVPWSEAEKYLSPEGKKIFSSRIQPKEPEYAKEENVDDEKNYEIEDDYPPVTSPEPKVSEVAEEDEDENDKNSTKKEDTPAASIEDFNKKLRFGLHLALGYAGVWHREEVPGMFDPYTTEISVKDPYNGFMGINFDIGLIMRYSISSIFSIVPEINVRFLDYFKESEVYYLKISDGSTAPIDENMILTDISMPLMLRANFTPAFFVEAGLQLNLNIYSTFSLSNDDYDWNEDLGEWKGEQFGWGINAGLGYTMPIGSGFGEIGARGVIDMTRIEANQDVYNPTNNTLRMPVATRAWAFQIMFNVFM